MSIKKYKSFVIFAIVSVIVVITTQKIFYQPDISRPQSDAFWYIDYSLGLKDNNTFGYSRTGYNPSNVIAPLYPAYLYLLLQLDENLATDFRCLLKNKSNTNCSINLSNLAWAQCILAIVALWCIWLIAFNLFNSISIAWLSSIISLLMGEILHYSNLVLTEIMTITLFSIFCLLMIKAINTKKLVWIGLASVNIGLLTLTRPEFHYLFLIYSLGLFLLFLIQRNKHILSALLVTVLAYFIIIGPWIGRNYYHFNDTALTSGYGDRVLATRISYNKMSWKEWGVAFIYWFPDTGDSVARRLFPAELYNKLTFEPGSYYTEYRRVLTKEQWEMPTSEIISYLVKTEIFGNIIKHTAVTILLSWRGLFIAKYWGVLGFLSFAILILKKESTDRNKLFLLSLPAFFIVFFHAFISLNIPRYNLILIPLYSISIAMIISRISIHIKQRLKSAE